MGPLCGAIRGEQAPCDANSEEKMVSKCPVSCEISFLLGGPLKVTIFPFSQVSGSFSCKYILNKRHLGIIGFKKDSPHQLRWGGFDLEKHTLPHNISVLGGYGF